MPQITWSFGEDAHHDRKVKSGAIDVKAVLAGDEEFLRALVRTALEEVLEAEMTEALSAEKGERTAGRQGYLSGYYGRTLITRIGKLELRVLQDRAGAVLNRAVLTVSTLGAGAGGGTGGDVGAGGFDAQGEGDHWGVARSQLLGLRDHAINQRLDASLAQFAGRPLAEAFPYLILDARYERVRESA
jgi:putative transposase